MSRNQPFQGPPGYHCIEELGNGSYGEVFLVRRPVPQSPKGETELVAIKRITDFANRTLMHGGDSVGFLRRICREICSLSFFNETENFFVVEALDFYLGESEVDLFIVMPYYNMSMYHLFQQPEHASLKKALEEKHIQWMMCQVLCGLFQMHESQVMHRDMTLGNLLMNKDTFECVIADFGLSRVQIDAGEEISLNVVSLTYRSPEIILSCKPYTNALDVWSCGVILAQLLTKSPFLQLPQVHEDAPQQLWAIMDQFAGFPTKSELGEWEKKNASRHVLRYLSDFQVRAERMRLIDEECARLMGAAPVPGEPKAAIVAGGATKDQPCVFCGEILGDLALPVVNVTNNATAALHGACIKPWQGSQNKENPPAEAGPGVPCSNCQAPLEKGADVVHVMNNAGGRFPFHMDCVAPWRLKMLHADREPLQKANPRPLPDPRDVGVLLQERAVLPNSQAGTVEALSDGAADVLRRMLVFDPAKRASVREVLEMPWWHEDPECSKRIKEAFSKKYPKCPDHVEGMDHNELVAYIHSIVTVDPWKLSAGRSASALDEFEAGRTPNHRTGSIGDMMHSETP